MSQVPTGASKGSMKRELERQHDTVDATNTTRNVADAIAVEKNSAFYHGLRLLDSILKDKGLHAPRFFMFTNDAALYNGIASLRTLNAFFTASPFEPFSKPFTERLVPVVSTLQVVDGLSSASSLDALMGAWPKRRVYDLHGIVLFEHAAAFNMFAKLATRAVDAQGRLGEARCMEWLDSLESPTGGIFPNWNDTTQPVKMSPVDKAMEEKLGGLILQPLRQLKRMDHLHSIAGFRAVLKEHGTPRVLELFPFLKPYMAWADAMLAKLAAATTVTAVAELYVLTPFSLSVLSLVFTNRTMARARLPRKMIKLIQVAFRARLEELAGNLERDAKPHDMGHHDDQHMPHLVAVGGGGGHEGADDNDNDAESPHEHVMNQCAQQ